MSLGVQSYSELYTMLLGWDLYDKLWSLLTQTGLAFIPFIGIILTNITRTYTSASHSSAEQSLRTMELHLIGTLLIVLLAVAPFIPLDVHTLSYSPTCGKAQGQEFHPGDTGTTYDKAFSLPTGDVRIPIWWYAVISVSEGMTSSANHLLGCVPDLRKMVTEVNMAQISDPAVKEQLEDFAAMCYAPARAEYLQDVHNNNANHLDQINDRIKKYGVEDTEWIGSHAYADVYYRNMKASHAVPGVPYNAANDINADLNQVNPPANGTPTCYDWWNSSNFGLKKKVLSSLPSNFKSEFKEYVSDEKNHDSIVKKIITRTPSYAGANDMIGDYGVTHVISSLGVWYHQLEGYPKIYAATQAAPIIQALILLLVYVFLPFALVFSGYKPTAFIAGSVLIFSLIFWTFIWHLISWTDKALMDALYPGWFEKQTPGGTLADMIIGSLVICAPLFWFMFMGAMGVALTNAVSSTLSGMGTTSEKAGSAVSRGTQTLVKQAGALITKV